jgi:hypothetical protein
MGNDFSDRKHLEVAPGMIVVLMRIQHISKRLVGNGPHLRQNIGVVPVEHVVNEDNALARGIERDITAFAGDHVKVAFDPSCAKNARRLLCLCVNNPSALKEEGSKQSDQERFPAHFAGLYLLTMRKTTPAPMRTATQCHNGPLLTNNEFHNTGVPSAPMLPRDSGRSVGAVAVLADEFNCRSPWSDAAPCQCKELDYMECGRPRAGTCL